MKLFIIVFRIVQKLQCLKYTGMPRLSRNFSSSSTSLTQQLLDKKSFFNFFSISVTAPDQASLITEKERDSVHCLTYFPLSAWYNTWYSLDNTGSHKPGVHRSDMNLYWSCLSSTYSVWSAYRATWKLWGRKCISKMWFSFQINAFYSEQAEF